MDLCVNIRIDVLASSAVGRVCVCMKVAGGGGGGVCVCDNERTRRQLTVEHQPAQHLTSADCQSLQHGFLSLTSPPPSSLISNLSRAPAGAGTAAMACDAAHMRMCTVPHPLEIILTHDVLQRCNTDAQGGERRVCVSVSVCLCLCAC